MMIVTVVPKLPQDPSDDNHVRIEDHAPRSGYTYTMVMVNGVPREVRSTSGYERVRTERGTFSTCLLHLRKVKRDPQPRLKCSDLADVHVLHLLRNRSLSLDEIRTQVEICRVDLDPYTVPPIKIVSRKIRKLMGLHLIDSHIRNDRLIFTLTPTGRTKLETARA